jgi:hypothetical protein
MEMEGEGGLSDERGLAVLRRAEETVKPSKSYDPNHVVAKVVRRHRHRREAERQWQQEGILVYAVKWVKNKLKK